MTAQLVNSVQGLTQEQAAEKLKEYGYNEIIDTGKISPFRILFRQVKQNTVIYLLVAAAVISYLVGKPITTFTIFGVISLVVGVGFIQEYKAEEAINSLKKMILPISFVLRGGKKTELPSRELVPGDIVLLGNGEKIPADCLILDSHELRVNESALTGESKEITKKPSVGNDLADENQVFMGTFIVNGRCTAQIQHTGMSTKFGKIAHLISNAEKELPLQHKVNQITKYMVVVAIVSSLATGLLMILRADSITTEVLVNILILVVALSVSAFPEGFPVVLATALAVGAKRMSQKNAIVNRMSIIETLGETTIICSDKTGTITRGEMTVKFIFTGNSLYKIEGSGFVAHGRILKDESVVDLSKDEHLHKLLLASVFCNGASIERTGIDAEYKTRGTPTEAALLILGAKAGIYKENLEGQLIEERPFNSDRKMMSLLYKHGDHNIVYAKGAPEVFIQKCSKYIKNSEEVKLTDEVRETFTKIQQEMASTSFRTLAIGYKNLDSSDKDYSEEDFVLLGLVSMEDPPREEVAAALNMAKAAGIKIRMITGDNKQTAAAIAKQIGLGENVVEGFEIDQMSDQELSVAVKKADIFARVKPEHKIRIVQILKQQDEIVAMTGDGVNDAPALKEAHVGIAMGKNGTDVSRSVADLTLKDDNFATIVAAVAEGRTVFNNIRKFATYQLSCNLAELSLLFTGVLLAPWLGWEVPLLASIQILFMNLVTDNLPAITLSLNPTSNDIMNEEPRRNATILNKTLIKLLIFSGALMSLFAFISYYVSFNVLGFSTVQSRTTALVTLILLEIAMAFSFRSFRKNTLNRSPFVNKYLLGASAISLLATILIIYTPLNIAFETTTIPLKEWIVSLVLALIGLFLHDLAKTHLNKDKQFRLDTR